MDVPKKKFKIPHEEDQLEKKILRNDISMRCLTLLRKDTLKNI